MTGTDCNAGHEPARGSVRAGQCQLGYLDWGGSGPPLVLLHGITSSARAWWQAGAAFAAQGYRVVAFDLPGHGKSDTTSGHHPDAIAGLVSLALEALALSGVALVGHSWGGAIALALASGPGADALTRVVLVDPALGMTPAHGATMLPNYLGGVGEPPEVTLPTIRQNNPAWHHCDIFWKGEALAECRVQAVEGLFINSGAWNLAPRLADVPVPLLLLVCDRQFSVIPAELLAMAQAALPPGLGRIEHIPDTNHNMLRGPGYTPTMAALTAFLHP